jgi:hypothetical protein
LSNRTGHRPHNRNFYILRHGRVRHRKCNHPRD